MLKTLFLLGISGLGLLYSQAQASTLLYGLDFNTMGTSGGLVFTNCGSGSTTISKTGGYNNYNENVPTKDGGYSHTTNGGTFSIANSAGIGVTATEGFTLTMHLKRNSNSSAWGDIFSMYFGNYGMKLEVKGSSNSLTFYDSVDGNQSNDGMDTGLSISTTQWNHIAITVMGAEMTFYLNGEQVATKTLDINQTGYSDTITKIQGGGAFSSHPDSSILVDNFGVFSGALTSDEIKGLVNNPITKPITIPEPTTATLSFLALAGLMARRRRVA